MSIKVTHIKPIHKDSRGSMIKVLEGKLTSVLLITSKKGTIRANHYHKKDTHYIYIVSGKARHTEMNMKAKKPRRQSAVLRPGDSVYTRSMVAHAVEFLEDTVFLALTTKSRKQKAYENDTVRIKLV